MALRHQRRVLQYAAHQTAPALRQPKGQLHANRRARRCPLAEDACTEREPPDTTIAGSGAGEPDHRFACFVAARQTAKETAP